MYDLNEKLRNELVEILNEMAELCEKEDCCMKENGIVPDDPVSEIHNIRLQIKSASNHFHLLQGFAAGVKYATLRKSKQNNWIVPERYSDTLEKVLGIEQTERLTSKN